MNSVHDANVIQAKKQFLSILSKLHPDECKDFLDWIIEQHTSLEGDHSPQDMQVALCDAFQNCIYVEESLKSIIEDLRMRLPISGICDSENMFIPETGQNSDCEQATTVVIDSFLYDENDIEKLIDENKLSRNYCKNCGSHDTSPLTYISHSMSLLQMKFIFQAVLPKLTSLSNTTLIDIGSRLGNVLFGAYYYSSIENIIGVEMNEELCHIQNEILSKYGLGNRIKIICNDVCNEGELLQKANIIILNNTFEFFMPREVQIRTWQNIRKHICRPSSIVITIPKVEESVSLGDGQKHILDIESWLVRINVDPTQFVIDYSDDDIEELSKLYFYKVK